MPEKNRQGAGEVPSRRRIGLGFRLPALLGLLALAALRGFGHSLPVSYLLVVADADYVHVELTFNPFELPQFAGVDTNANRRLDPGELDASGERLAREVLNHLTLRVGGREVSAETAGLTADPDSHHVTLRAHYRVVTGVERIAVESRLPRALGSSHLTQVKCVRDGQTAFAQLDSRSPRASFPPEPPALETKRARRSNANSKPDP